MAKCATSMAVITAWAKITVKHTDTLTKNAKNETTSRKYTKAEYHKHLKFNKERRQLVSKWILAHI